MANTKAHKVLEFIKSKGAEGASLKEIQTFICRMNGRIGPTEERPYKDRGYWCDYLVGNSPFHSGRYGLLHLYCSKNDHGRWVLVEDAPAKNFCTKKTETYKNWVKEGDVRNKAFAKCLPRCPNCKHYIPEMPQRERRQWTMRSRWAPDLQACVSSWSHVMTDCKRRVWSPKGKLTTITPEQGDKISGSDKVWELPYDKRHDKVEEILAPFVIKG